MIKLMENFDYTNHPFAEELKALLKKYNAEIEVEYMWDKLAREHLHKMIATIDRQFDEEGNLLSKTEIDLGTSID